SILACEDTNAKALLKYGTSVNKCQTKCENDYTDSKGNGGPTDSTTQCALASASADMTFKLCAQAARAKLDAQAVDGSGKPTGTGVNLILDGGLKGPLDRADNRPDNPPLPP